MTSLARLAGIDECKKWPCRAVSVSFPSQEGPSESRQRGLSEHTLSTFPAQSGIRRAPEAPAARRGPSVCTRAFTTVSGTRLRSPRAGARCSQKRPPRTSRQRVRAPVTTPIRPAGQLPRADLKAIRPGPSPALRDARRGPDAPPRASARIGHLALEGPCQARRRRAAGAAAGCPGRRRPVAP